MNNFDRDGTSLKGIGLRALGVERSEMERVANKARGFAQADEWDVRQNLAMTSQERQRAARQIKERMYPHSEDIRDCLRDKSIPVTFRKMRRTSCGCSILMQSASFSSEEKPSFFTVIHDSPEI